MIIKDALQPISEGDKKAEQLLPYTSLPSLRARIRDTQFGPEIRFTHGIQGERFVSTAVSFDAFVEHALGLLDYKYEAINHPGAAAPKDEQVRFSISDVQDLNEVIVDLILADCDRVLENDTAVFHRHTTRILDEIRERSKPPTRSRVAQAFTAAPPFTPPDEVDIVREIMRRTNRADLRQLILSLFVDTLNLETAVGKPKDSVTDLSVGNLQIHERYGRFDMRGVYNQSTFIYANRSRPLTIEAAGDCILVPKIKEDYVDTHLEIPFGIDLPATGVRPALRNAPTKNPLQLGVSPDSIVLVNKCPGILRIALGTNSISSIQIAQPITGNLEIAGPIPELHALHVGGDVRISGQDRHVQFLEIGGSVILTNCKPFSAVKVCGNVSATDSKLIVNTIQGTLRGINCSGVVQSVGSAELMNSVDLKIVHRGATSPY